MAGAVAERTKTQAYFAYSFLIGAIIYPLYGHWVWGGGWLGSLDAIGLPAAADYAGSGVVHAVGGFVALAGAAVVGPRMGKFNADGSANDLRGHNVPFVIIGTFILFFGWFGFNINSGGSIGLNAINTLLAGATGAVVALYAQLIRTGKADILMSCNGALAGLVGITAPVAHVDPWAAVVIGAIAAPIMMISVSVIEKVFKIDDPVGAVSVHGTCGLWGLLAVGIFANGNNDVNGLVGGDALQIVLPANQHGRGAGLGAGNRFPDVPGAEGQHGRTVEPGGRGNGCGRLGARHSGIPRELTRARSVLNKVGKQGPGDEFPGPSAFPGGCGKAAS